MVAERPRAPQAQGERKPAGAMKSSPARQLCSTASGFRCESECRKESSEPLYTNN